jgi:hypothetical protein
MLVERFGIMPLFSECTSSLTSRSPEVELLKQQLKIVNDALWDIEDKIRAKEVTKSLDQQ